MNDKQQATSCHRQGGRKKKDREYALSEDKLKEIRQQSNYNEYNKATPDNNPFFESRNNPLSSKGN